jgi:DNA-binding LacI/PurR family transcriptional regulator
MDLANMTLEEVSLRYGNYIEENIASFSNEQLTTLMNQITAIHAAAAKQLAKNLENEKKLNQQVER